MGRYRTGGRLLVLWGLALALALLPPTAWSQAPPPYPLPFLLATQAALQQIVAQHLAAAGTPGALVGVWLPGRGTWVQAVGLGDVATGAPLQLYDMFRIGSITKPFTATVLLQLV